MVMQKFLGFFEELNAYPDDYIDTLRTAFSSMIELHPDKAKEAFAIHAQFSDIIRMSLEYQVQISAANVTYCETQKAIEDREGSEFATKLKVV